MVCFFSPSIGKNLKRAFEVGYRDCQKNVPVFERFFLQALMPRFLNSEQNYEKRYKIAKDSSPLTAKATECDIDILGKNFSRRQQQIFR
jgi:hypothetical protein